MVDLMGVAEGTHEERPELADGGEMEGGDNYPHRDHVHGHPFSVVVATDVLVGPESAKRRLAAE